ncbi:MAG: NADH:ubiquinone oxidoreductase subunit NDUFA12 [Pseudomonadota bacterium]
MSLLSEIFVWWDRQTLGTRLMTARKGERVGEDDLGNVYYRERNGERRWVVYSGVADASCVPPEWHGWLHYIVDTPPSEEDYTPRDWQKPHKPNMTGTPGAYRPRGSTLSAETRPQATGDYEAWSPE